MVTRVAVIDRDICTNIKCGYACIKVCPPNRMGEECIVIEKGTVFPAIAEHICIGCGLCVKKCPVHCIAIVNLAQELKEPIYQYGVNTFRLYGLPLPIEGAVSLVGKNGIGKTTAIKLLSRQIVPNFANFSKEYTEQEILDKLSLDVKRYFVTTKDGIKVSVKPQHIDRIRDAFNGTARELLHTVLSQDKIVEIAKTFKIEEILERKISQLSGGELQKVAIAVACAKEAEIYYFDEVTNYLDIEERLRIGVIIKDLAERKKVVMAEHDLTILDYVSNYVHIIYGDENVYGVVSGVKNVRTGINEYIAGYLKDENVRFRNHEIEFSQHSEGEIRTPTLLKYDILKKKFKGFDFSSDPGEIKKGEILGLVGKNALGKSLFVKMLVGIEKADEGQQITLKVSYKPQYITAEDVYVSELFRDKNLDLTILEECKRRLNVGMFFDKKLTELSGGELQRVALSLALSQKADIYLFDEPSAFLDIEQRFEFAGLLRKVISESEKSAFVVDHDIVFVDAIANRLIVFDGKSSVRGHASAPLNKKNGMNSFLKVAGITMRRDRDTKRPRINKPGSQLDSEQIAAGEYFYYNRESG
ncbi:Trehalose/maltose import ATP-binding protein MalK [Candidatus Bilamarchaeum dharawalense]|uniref:Trehalose/maltose import ATP-binding protein MalK n=1 Tax=Candidatus Bilamarchaeum dharawalense TaxID=2885759 RepID=A0A5E4LM87_9ARCH|nr:Trehalose/maltose import ATP-binding protein MalK [Candidatus Bilamarchaeum dharawalense]